MRVPNRSEPDLKATAVVYPCCLRAKDAAFLSVVCQTGRSFDGADQAHVQFFLIGKILELTSPSI